MTMVRSGPVGVAALTLLGTLVLTLVACSRDQDGETTAPDPEPTTGSLEITAATVAGRLDPDGFQVVLDGGEHERTIGPDETEVFLRLAAGDHTVELADVATRCTVTSDNPLDVTVSAGTTARATFELECRLLDRIVFSSSRDGDFDIYVMEIDGSSPENVSRSESGERHPAVSPDATRIVFSSNRDGNTEIYVMEVDGSNPSRLTDNEARDFRPAWSPDGSRIVFASDRDGDLEIYVMEADGSDPRRLTENPARDTRPDWSPDGSRIAFASDRDGDTEIYIVDVDGSGPAQPLTESTGADDSPDWSPDGSQIAFSSTRDGGDHEIYVVCVNRARPAERLTDNEATDGRPVWSPDRERIAFASAAAGENDIYVMGTDGSNPQRLTDHAAIDEHPGWTPQSGLGRPTVSEECQVVNP